MVLRKTLVRTVAFWRFVDAETGKPLKEQIDWPKAMARLERERLRLKKLDQPLAYSVDSALLTGGVHTIGNVDHLVVTNERDDIPRQRNRSTGEVADVATKGAGWGVIESSFVMFAEYGNVFGLLRSQITAPSPQAVAKWINRAKLFSRDLAVVPVIDPERWRNLQRAGGVVSVEFAAPSFVLDKKVRGPLGKYLGPAQNGTFDVDLKLSTRRTRHPQYAQERRELKEVTEGLATEIGVEYLTKAVAKTFDEDNEGIKSDTINLIEQRFSIKRPVALKGAGSASVQESSAFSAILEGFEQYDKQLRAAVDEDD